MGHVVEPAPLTVSVDFDGAKPSVLVSGQVGDSNIGDVVSALDRLFEEHEACVSLDLAGVETMEPVVLRDLAESAGSYAQQNRRLNLRPARPGVQNLLEGLPLADIFCTEHECQGDYCLEKLQAQSPAELEWDIFTLPADPSSCGVARTRVDRVAQAIGFCQRRREDVMIAVGEAAANAVRHGRTGAEYDTFTVVCHGTPEKLCISVSDAGPGFSIEDIADPEDASVMERGRGICCMRAVMDEVSFSFHEGTTVRMVKFGA